MTMERQLVYIHKLLHEEIKHRQDDQKDLQKQQVKAMEQLLAGMDIEEQFAEFCKSQNPGFLACPPNSCPTEAEIAALKEMNITALQFPCLRFADNGKSAMGMWLAQTRDGTRAIAAEFLPWGKEWKLWKLILKPGTDNLPAQPYARKYPDPKELPQPPMGFGSPGGPGGPGGPPPAGGPGGPAPAPGGPGGPPPAGGPGGPGGPGGGEDSPPFDPDAREDVFDMQSNYDRLTSDIVMLTTRAFPDYKNACAEADALMEKCRKAVSPEYVLRRMDRRL